MGSSSTHPIIRYLHKKGKENIFTKLWKYLEEGEACLQGLEEIWVEADGASDAFVQAVRTVRRARLASELGAVDELCEGHGAVQVLRVVRESVQKQEDVTRASHAMTDPWKIYWLAFSANLDCLLKTFVPGPFSSRPFFQVSSPILRHASKYFLSFQTRKARANRYTTPENKNKQITNQNYSRVVHGKSCH